MAVKNGSVESIHPPLRQIGFDYQSVNINASPFKIIDDSNEVSKKDVSKIMEQNNFTNQHLHTIGQQLNRIEETVQTPISTVLHPTLDQPVFKPHEIPTRFNKSLSKPDFVSELDKKLVEAKRQISDSISNQLSSIIVPDTPEPSSRMTGRIAVLDQTDSDTNSISSEQSKTCPNELNKLKWKDPQKLYYSKTTPPDLLLEEKPQIFHNKYQANAIYEWNIDGMSEYNNKKQRRRTNKTVNQKANSEKHLACCNSRIFYCLLFTVSFSLYNHEATFLVYKRSPSLSFFKASE